MAKQVELTSEEIGDYLEGSQFSNGLVIKCPTTPPSPRISKIVELVRDKSVIHFGFCDHLPLLEKKIASGNWLHAILESSCNACVGLDLDRNAVTAINARFDRKVGHEFDLFADDIPEEVQNSQWDYVVMGEILEHVDDPVAFLQKMKEKFQTVANSLIITVPNAFDLTNRPFLRDNAEVINTDHRYWFTPYTLSKVATRSGMPMRSLYFCDSTMETSWLRRWRLKRLPILSETLLAVLPLAHDAEHDA